MAKGFDCATPLTAETAAAFKASGYEFVCRYLVPSGWKMLTKEEADAIQVAGLMIVSVFETTADRALGRYQAGLQDGSIAARCAKDVGQPTESTIYFAVDFDVTTAAQMQNVIEYIRGANDATPQFSTGVYGEYEVVEAVKAAGAASHFWQTYAWSRGKLADCQIFQWQNDTKEDGIDVGIDKNRSYGCEGWWGTPPAELPAAPEGLPPLDPGVALTILNTWMKPAYDAATDPGQKVYIRWLGQMLRNAAGLPLE
jgi:hypothetical protein